MSTIKDRTVLVTGANGFIGSALCHAFKGQGATVIGLTRANCDYTSESISSSIKTHKPDIVVHAAGNASVLESYNNPKESEDSSISLTRTVLDGLCQAKPDTQFVYLSSAAVYGNSEGLPINEGDPKKPISLYGQQKLHCEYVVEETSTVLETAPIIIRIFSLFGANQKRLVLYELYNQFIDSNRKHVEIKGTGQETRDFLSIDVFCQKTLNLLNSPLNITSPLKINIASGESHSIVESAALMKAILGNHKEIICAGEEMKGNPAHWRADTSLYNQLVKERILFDFKEELSKTIGQWKNQTAL